MPGIGGLATLEELLKIDSDAVVLMITAYATFDTAVSAWEKGAAGIVRKPFQNEQIINLVANGVKKRRKEEERQTLRQAMTREVKRGAIVDVRLQWKMFSGWLTAWRPRVPPF
jgi:DNA-binding NtrC family response regulator